MSLAPPSHVSPRPLNSLLYTPRLLRRFSRPIAAAALAMSDLTRLSSAASSSAMLARRLLPRRLLPDASRRRLSCVLDDAGAGMAVSASLASIVGSANVITAAAANGTGAHAAVTSTIAHVAVTAVAIASGACLSTKVDFLWPREEEPPGESVSSAPYLSISKLNGIGELRHVLYFILFFYFFNFVKKEKSKVDWFNISLVPRRTFILVAKFKRTFISGQHVWFVSNFTDKFGVDCSSLAFLDTFYTQI